MMLLAPCSCIFYSCHSQITRELRNGDLQRLHLGSCLCVYHIYISYIVYRLKPENLAISSTLVAAEPRGRCSILSLALLNNLKIFARNHEVRAEIALLFYLISDQKQIRCRSVQKVQKKVEFTHICVMAVVNFIFLGQFFACRGRQVDPSPHRLSGSTASPRRSFEQAAAPSR